MVRARRCSDAEYPYVPTLLSLDPPTVEGGSGIPASSEFRPFLPRGRGVGGEGKQAEGGGGRKEEGGVGIKTRWLLHQEFERWAHIIAQSDALFKQPGG